MTSKEYLLALRPLQDAKEALSIVKKDVRYLCRGACDRSLMLRKSNGGDWPTTPGGEGTVSKEDGTTV